MPSPPKERPSGHLGRLLAALRPSRAGPLPVQTGFPTSLADLVVKNHSRLKKQPSPSSKHGKRGAAASPSPSPSPPASPPPPPPPPAAAISPSDRPRPDDLPPALLAPRRVKGGSFGLGLGLGFLAAVGVVSLALLVIWSKKVVATVTVASFSLFLLESVRSRSLPRRPRPAVPEKRLYLDGRGRVSPIRELEAEAEPPRPSCCSDSDRGSEASALAVEDTSGALEEPSNPKAKKRSWKKLIAGAKRLHKGRKSSKDADPPGGSFRGSKGDEEAGDATARGGNARAADPSGSRRRQTGVPAAVEDAVFPKEPDSARTSRRIQGVEMDAALPAAVEIDASVDTIEEEEGEDKEERGRRTQAGVRFPALALVAVALVGLVAGKAPAVALTVLCHAFCSSAQRLATGGGGCPGTRLEVSVSY